MARKRRSKNFSAVPFSTDITLGTLANNTVLQQAILPSMAEDAYIISVDCEWSIDNLTSGEWPVEVGFSHGDYTAAEVQECITVNLADPHNLVAKEHSRRKVRRAGKFAGSSNESLNDGRPIRTKCKWVNGGGKDFDAWAYNRSGSALTTGAVINCSGTIYLKWLL